MRTRLGRAKERTLYRRGRKGHAEDAKASERLRRHRVPLRILRVLCVEVLSFLPAFGALFLTTSLSRCEINLRRYTAILPPSTTIVVPVMNAPAGEASNSAVPAMSTGCPSRRNGVSASTLARRSGFS